MSPLRTLCLTNFSVDSKRVTEWAQCHHIRHLGLDGGAESLQLLTLFTGKMPDMTSLTLRIHHGTSPDITDDLYTRLDKFLQHVNDLPVAAFTAYELSKSILLFLVSRRGPHLRRLRFWQTNFNMRDQDQEQIRCLFNFEELQNLAGVLPRLQRLGIDLRFKGHLPYVILSGVACFPSLEHLELNASFSHGECGINGREPLVNSWLNAAVAEEAFRYVAGEKRSYGRIARIAGSTTVPWSPFEGLDIKVGEWEPCVEGYRKSISLTNPIFLYACRWLACRPGKVDIVRLKCLAQQWPIEDDLYEQALARAGLWDVPKLLSGPGTL
ncbi:hypothetical protein P168DRAFT_315919 [Aspergillus campestris IBT 28561]|uniref:Uncharacterized protein n=1 Tax=Aspergillus campestris (strain IBT 28561) TaxID=1392248 RepID=A0A2I1DC22_ASPC2|nr:uncharacterized protein P168DRAFT_315919 [Aspergillus campestris IBT 28561]PKY07410.1 hypothetical protein P168DRAFT_315919 [Aspergillus campestris IBT 28561]